MAQQVGSISEIWRFPVKSMAGERLESAALTADGILGDRAFALFDVETGQVASAKNVRDFPGLMACSARFARPPEPGDALPHVQITLANGHELDSHAADAARQLSDFFDRDVRLISEAPDAFLIDQYHPDMAGLDPAEHRDIIVQQPLGASLFKALAQQSPLAPHSLQDVFPLSLITTSTLSRLKRHAPRSDFDTARFRMNLVVETDAPGPIENGWAGQTGALGTAALHFTMPDPRCVMATRATAHLPHDTEVLRAIVQSNRLELPGIGAFPCAGVYAVIAQAGMVRLGDALEI